jgi:NAD(P)-dependent dehydrogenase (short-subunit alcohol dehydrogenase family)
MATAATLDRSDWKEGRDEEVLSRTPLRRIGDPDELADIVCFLASDESRHMTGNFVLCDGGFSMVGA